MCEKVRVRGTLNYDASSCWHACTLTGESGRAGRVESGGRTLTGGSDRAGRVGSGGPRSVSNDKLYVQLHSVELIKVLLKKRFL